MLDRMAYSSPAEVYSGPDYIVAKERYTNYFRKEIHKTLDYYPYKDDQMIYRVDIPQRTIFFDVSSRDSA